MIGEILSRRQYSVVSLLSSFSSDPRFNDSRPDGLRRRLRKSVRDERESGLESAKFPPNWTCSHLALRRVWLFMSSTVFCYGQNLFISFQCRCGFPFSL